MALIAPEATVVASPALLVAGAIVLGAALDRTFGEFPGSIHPVALLGHTIEPFDRPWSRPRLVGLVIAIGIPLLAAGVAAGAVVVAGVAGVAVGAVIVDGGTGAALGGWFATALATLLAAVVVYATTSLRMLLDAVDGVVAHSATDPESARRALPALAGRDPELLSPAEIRSAAVESAAENLADGLVAPLLGFLVGVGIVGVVVLSRADGTGPPVVSPTITLLAGGAGGTAWVKAVNTLDSMLGYPHKPVGWAPARLDDLVMWLPARLCAAAIGVAAMDPTAPWRARNAARVPASPNAGWPMATLAAVLGVELAKPGHYTLACGPALPTVADAESGVRIVARAGWLSFAVAIVTAWLLVEVLV